MASLTYIDDIVNGLNSALTVLGTRLTNAETNNTTLTTQNNSLSTDKATLLSQSSAQATTISGLQNDKITLQGQITTLQSQILAATTVTLSASQSQNEGNSGPTLYTYTVTRTNVAGAISVPWTFAAGNTNASDYTGGVLPTGGTVSMANGVATGTFTISVNGDTTVEPTETFTVAITAPVGYNAGSNMSATGTIVNDDTPSTPAPTFSVQPSISPNGGFYDTTYTGNDGTITNGSVSRRRWLSNGVAIDDNMHQTIVPSSVTQNSVTGPLTYEVTATGSGGTTVATSAAVTVTNHPPAFSHNPVVTPSSAAANTVFTGTTGAYTNGNNQVSYRWLLNDAPIAFATAVQGASITVTPTQAGSLVLEITATSSGGNTVVTSLPVTVNAASSLPTNRLADFTTGTYNGISPVSARSTIGYAHTVAGTLTKFTANTLRTTDKGLLIEDVATNLYLYSEALDNTSYWGQNNVTVQGNQAVSPNGETTADLLTLGSGNSLDNNNVCTVIDGGSSYTVSAYVKPVSAASKAAFFQFNTSNSLTDHGGLKASLQLFDLVNKAAGSFQDLAGSVAFTNPTVKALANGWTRCSVTFAANGRGSVGSFFGISAGAGSYSAAGSGSQMDIFGVQIEKGTATSSYFPTTSASGTRDADQISFTVPSNTNYLKFGFDDGTAQSFAVTPNSTYSIPTTFARRYIQYADTVTVAGTYLVDNFAYTGDVTAHSGWYVNSGVLTADGNGNAIFANGGPVLATGINVGNPSQFIQFTVTSGSGQIPLWMGFDGGNWTKVTLRSTGQANDSFVVPQNGNAVSFPARFNVNDVIRVESTGGNVNIYLNGTRVFQTGAAAGPGNAIWFYNVNDGFTGIGIAHLSAGPL